MHYPATRRSRPIRSVQCTTGRQLHYTLFISVRQSHEPDVFASWWVSPDRKYLYCSTGGKAPEALRIPFADHTVETITSLTNMHLVNDPYIGIPVNGAPDGSLVLTRDTGTQEIYALTVKWP